jgi:ankyrin repeat protein
MPGRRALHECVMEADIDALATALTVSARSDRTGAKLREHNQEGLQPLHIAAMIEDLLPLEMLLTSGAPVSGVSDPGGETALHIAAAWDGLGAATRLLDCGADAEARTGRGATALHRACAMGATAVAELLIERGADPCAADECGRTPLHVAAEHNQTTLVAALVAAGADAVLGDSAGRTAIDVAQGAARLLLCPAHEDHALAAWLETKGLAEHTPLFQAHQLPLEQLIAGTVTEATLQHLQVPIGVRLRLLHLIKSAAASEDDRRQVGWSTPPPLSLNTPSATNWLAPSASTPKINPLTVVRACCVALQAGSSATELAATRALAPQRRWQMTADGEWFS